MIEHVLVVDDDKKIRNLLSEILRENGYVVSLAESIKETEEQLKYSVFDLIIMDVLMPQESALEFLNRVKIDIPIMLVTALGHVDDRINGLELGADDYLVKPFEPKELLLRMRKILDRKGGVNNDKISIGDFVFDINTGNLMLNQNNISLTGQEKRLLKLFIERVGKSILREELKEIFGVSERTIDTIVARLRSKIEKDSKRPVFLHTIRGIGYIFYLDNEF